MFVEKDKATITTLPHDLAVKAHCEEVLITLVGDTEYPEAFCTWTACEGGYVVTDPVRELTLADRGVIERLYDAEHPQPAPSGPPPKSYGKGVPHSRNTVGTRSYSRARGSAVR